MRINMQEDSAAYHKFTICIHSAHLLECWVDRISYCKTAPACDLELIPFGNLYQAEHVPLPIANTAQDSSNLQCHRKLNISLMSSFPTTTSSSYHNHLKK